MLSETGRNFCWGGGTAIRRSTFEQAGVLDEWKNSVSDDYSLTRTLERQNRPIVFIPECLTLSYAETDFHKLLEFTNPPNPDHPRICRSRLGFRSRNASSVLPDAAARRDDNRERLPPAAARFPHRHADSSSRLLSSIRVPSGSSA